MYKYKFVFSNGLIHNQRFDCDLDAMQRSRQLLALMKSVNQHIHYVQVWGVTPSAKYRFVAAYA